MEGDLDYVKTPLLSCTEDHEKPNGNGRFENRNSFTSLKCDFFSKLPEKLRSGLDPEALLHLDLTKTSGLMEGINSKFSALWLNLSCFSLILAIIYKCNMYYLVFRGKLV